MKTSHDPRHIRRIKILRELFAWEFSESNQPKEVLTRQIIEQLPQLDREISQAAPEWPIKQVNRIDLSILRLAAFELIIEKDQPFKVVVDEAVELAKEFGAQSSPGFVNAVLGNLIAAHKIAN